MAAAMPSTPIPRNRLRPAASADDVALSHWNVAKRQSTYSTCPWVSSDTVSSASYNNGSMPWRDSHASSIYHSRHASSTSSLTSSPYTGMCESTAELEPRTPLPGVAELDEKTSASITPVGECEWVNDQSDRDECGDPTSPDEFWGWPANELSSNWRNHSFDYPRVHAASSFFANTNSSQWTNASSYFDDHHPTYSEDPAKKSHVPSRLATLSRKLSKRYRSATGTSSQGGSASTTRSRASSSAASIFDKSVNSTQTRNSYTTPLTASLIEEQPEEHDEEFKKVVSMQSLDAAVQMPAPTTLKKEKEDLMTISTPNLPPALKLITDDIPVQSPLPSPKIVSAPPAPLRSMQSFSAVRSPVLSTKASFASLRAPYDMRAMEASPTTESDEKWERDLGHMDYFINPQPYIPSIVNLEACRSLRNDWREAERQYKMYLATVAEHNNSKSKVYRLTEEKWAEIHAQWSHNYQTTVRIVRDALPGNADITAELYSSAPDSVARIPSVSHGQAMGKLLRVGDNGIIGPMEQGPPLIQPDTKRGFLKRIFSGLSLGNNKARALTL